MRRRALFLALPLLLAAGPAPAASAPTAGAVHERVAAGATTKVVIVTLDSVGSRAVRLAGRTHAPTLHRLMRRGASTLNARTAREQTVTLPNHTTMVTGRRIDAKHNGHGVTWNDERARPATVQEAAGHPVRSVFSVVHSRQRSTGLFVSKEKLRLFKRSWSGAIDRTEVVADNGVLARKARRDLVKHRRALTFLHLSGPDVVGHDRGFLSKAHLAAVQRADRLLARMVAAIKARPRLRRHVTLIVTADHGGAGKSHSNPTERVNFRIPFVVWGAGVKAGADLYDLNPGDYGNPGTRRTRYGEKRPPIRNGDAANLATDLLGLRAVPGSQFNAEQSLDVR
jgi:predicted AlkP superfamily pyrophosphatase or phosphodiesterase